MTWEEACDRIDETVWAMAALEDDSAPEPAMTWHERRLRDWEIALDAAQLEDA